MGYRDRKRQELKRELRGMSATELYQTGCEIYADGLRQSQLFPRGSAPLTRLGDMALQRYFQGKPERRLP